MKTDCQYQSNGSRPQPDIQNPPQEEDKYSSSQIFYISDSIELPDEEELDYQALQKKKKDLQALILQNPNDPKYLFDLAKLQADLGDLEKCLNHLQICIDLKPKSKKKYLNVFEDILSKSGKKEQLLKFFNKQIGDQFNVGYYKFAKAQLLQDMGRYEEAERQYIQCIKENPKDEDCYTALGLMLMKIGREQDSQIVLKKGYNLNPFNDISRIGLGNLYMGKEEDESVDFKLCKSHIGGGVMKSQINSSKFVQQKGGNVERSFIKNKVDDTIECETEAVLRKKLKQMEAQNRRLKQNLKEKDEKLLDNLGEIRKNRRQIQQKNIKIALLEGKSKKLDQENAQLKKQLSQFHKKQKYRQQNLQNIGLCKICLDKKSSVIFVDCGHLCLCTTCDQSFKGDYCPLCRVVSRRQNVYNSYLFFDS